MPELSLHTHQINLWIALSKFQDTFSNTLGELGYECDVIEERLYIYDDDDETIINPDIVLTADNDEHSLVVECKSENPDIEQLQRYTKLFGNEDQLVLQRLVTEVEAEQLSIDIVLSSFSELADEEIPNQFAIVHFDLSPSSGLVIWNLDNHPFKDDSVSDAFPINVNPGEPLPTGHYPFDVYEADKEAMVSNVFSSVMSLAMNQNEFSIEDILNRSHPFWDQIGRQKRDALYERVDTIYHELLNAGLDEYLEKIAGTEGREWRRTSGTIQAVQDETEYYVNQVMEELPQARLDHYAWSSDSTAE